MIEYKEKIQIVGNRSLSSLGSKEQYVVFLLHSVLCL